MKIVGARALIRFVSMIAWRQTKNFRNAAVVILLSLAAAPSFAQEWIQKFPLNSPSPRWGFDMAYDAAHSQIVLFGGADASNPRLNDTWVWDGTNWTQKFPATSPPNGGSRSLVYDAARGQIVMFGGADTFGTGLNETWVWDGSNWTQKFPASSPPPRFGCHDLAYDQARQRVVLFGCGTSATSKFNDTWLWDGTNWTQQFPNHAPPANDAFGIAYDALAQHTLVFGGAGIGDVSLNDTWAWDGTDWTQQLPSVVPPTPRWFPGMAYHEALGKIVMFGGSGPTLAFLKGDTWLWDGSNWMQTFPSVSPAARVNLGMAYDSARQQVVLFGGRDSGGSDPSGFFGDTWVFPFCPSFVGSATISGSMEGNLAINPGDTVKAGYNFTIPGSHPANIITAISGNVTLPVSCPNGSTQTLTIDLPRQSYNVAQNDNRWFPSGNQSSSLVYQGSVTAPTTLCGGVQGHAPKGATFVMQFGATASSKFNVRFHYSDNSAGGWSGTLGVQPSASSACF